MPRKRSTLMWVIVVPGAAVKRQNTSAAPATGEPGRRVRATRRIGLVDENTSLATVVLCRRELADRPRRDGEGVGVFAVCGGEAQLNPFQCLALRVIEVVVEVCQRRVTRACRNGPEGSTARVSVSLPYLRLAAVSWGR